MHYRFLKISQLHKFMYKIVNPLSISSMKISDFISFVLYLKYILILMKENIIFFL